MGIGKMKLSSEDIKKTNKGVAIEMVHYLNDAMFKIEVNRQKWFFLNIKFVYECSFLIVIII